MNVVKLIVQETGTYNGQYRRPYTTVLNAQTADAIFDAVNGKQSISAAMMAGTAMNFITPVATPEAQVIIPNGWNTPRLRFLLEVCQVDNMGMSITEHITGYTEYSDQSYGDRLDPKMRFFINNISQTRQVKQVTPLGTQSYHSLIDSSQVVVNNQYNGMMGANKVYGLRPENVLNQIDEVDLRSGLEPGDTMFNTTTAIISQPVKSSRKNNIAPVYVASMLDGYAQTARADGDNKTHSDLVSSTIPLVESQSYTTDPFLMFMQRINASKGFGATLGNSFTLEDLVKLDTNTPNVTKLAKFAQGGVHQTGQTNDWGGSDGITTFAATLAQALPSYLSQFCFNRINFTATNYTQTGEIATVVTNVKGFNNSQDLSSVITSFIFRLNTELLRGLSYNNQMPFQIEVNCDLIGETWIELSLNGEPMVTYVYPSFCDALATPVVTTNAAVLDNIARDFSNLMSNIADSSPQSMGLSKPQHFL